MTDTHLHLVRVTLEAISPLSLGNGDAVDDERATRDDPEVNETIRATALLRDANGLPTVPGASLQGVLSHLYRQAHGDEADTAMFGYAQGDRGAPGRLTVGFGCVHDQHDVAVIGLRLGQTNDQVLGLLAQEKLLWRDHVALGPRHVVAGHQKFARTAVPVGTRFSFELSLRGAAQDPALLDVLALFTHPDFRLGGASARGYGRVRVVRVTRAVCDLADPTAIRTLRADPPSAALTEVLHDPTARPPRALAPVRVDTVTARVTLTPLNPWRIGGASPSMTTDTRGIRAANGSEDLIGGALVAMDRRTETDEQGKKRDNTLTIARERRLRRGAGPAVIDTVGAASPFDADHPGAFALPGSGLRGPLVHRAVFHFNRHRPNDAGMIDADAWLKLPEAERTAKLADLAKRPDEFRPLFGAAKGSQTDAAAARLRVNDGTITGVTHVMAVDHVKIDRFTGGVINGALYAEEVLVGGQIGFEIDIRPPSQDTDGVGGWPHDMAQAFLRALADLCAGRLAIGAKSLGFCTGSVAWSGEPSQAGEWAAAWTRVAPGGTAP